jgi:hypothetical protein
VTAKYLPSLEEAASQTAAYAIEMGSLAAICQAIYLKNPFESTIMMC